MKTTDNKVVWILFEGSGIGAQPWAEAGYTVYCFNADDGDHGAYAKFGCRVEHPNIHYVNTWIDTDWCIEATQSGKWGEPCFVIGWPPCTDMAVSGARHFEAKLEADPECQNKAAEMARITADIADWFNIPYMVENPVSILSTLWRKPDHMFHPYEYGGYLPENDEHPMFPEYIRARDAYTKKTCIWSGNGFIMPEKKPVEVDQGDLIYSLQYAKLGGKSVKTKTIRSLTARGFARAVFLANNLLDKEE